MKKTICIIIFFVLSFQIKAQFVATMEIKEWVAGLCDQNNVYVILPISKKQIEAKCPLSNKEITKRLNNEVQFLKDSTKYNDKGMVNLIINCKGEVVRCEIDNKTRHPELDKQIVTIFNALGEWKPGKVSGSKVDTARLFSFDIKDGKITVN